MLSLLPFLLFQAAAPTPSAVELSDARCVFLFAYFGSRGNPAQEAQAKLGTMYFVGKIRGRNPSADFGKLLAAATAEAKRSSINPQVDGSRCEREYQAAATDLANGAKSVNTPAKP